MCNGQYSADVEGGDVEKRKLYHINILNKKSAERVSFLREFDSFIA